MENIDYIYDKNYFKLEEAIAKNELYDYLSSTPHYRCPPDLGFDAINDFRTVVININYYLDNHPEKLSYFRNTIYDILKNGNYYEVFSVSHIIRKQYSWQFHGLSNHNIIDSNIFIMIKQVIIKYYELFKTEKRYTGQSGGMLDFYESWNEFLLANSKECILETHSEQQSDKHHIVKDK